MLRMRRGPNTNKVNATLTDHAAKAMKGYLVTGWAFMVKDSSNDTG